MMSVSTVSAGAAGSRYYSQEGYYATGSAEAREASAWFGKGAEEIGLTDTIDDARFTQILDGIAPDGRKMGRIVDGERQHRPGLDLTFSASKSASVAALILGDTRIIRAHDAAVREALSIVEDKFLHTRWQQDGKMVTGPGEGIIAGIFRHDTSRALDPQLHSHAVIANMVKNREGGWSALTNEGIFRNQKLITGIYRAAFERHLADEGIVTERGRYGEVNLVGIPDKVTEGFSKRREEIIRALDGRNLPHTPELAAKAALATRAAKHKTIDRTALRESWQREAVEYGMDKSLIDKGQIPSIQPQKAQAWLALTGKGRAVAQRTATRIVEVLQRLLGLGARAGAAQDGISVALDRAIEHLSERQSVFSHADLAVAAMEFGRGMAFGTLEEQIDRRISSGLLLAAGDDRDKLTTDRILAQEKSILSTMKQAGNTPALQLSHEEGRSPEKTLTRRLEKTNTLNDGQRAAIHTALTGKGRYVGIQGYAGTGKTFMLERLAHYAAESGYEIKGYAPTRQAVGEMTSAISGARTLASLIMAERHNPVRINNSRSIIVVDEASMMSTPDMRSFMDYAERTQAARVVFVGDVRQLDAVARGQPFAQMQKAGLRTAVMNEIRRQENPELRQAVYAAIRGEIARAFNRIGENISQEPQPVMAAAKAWTALPRQDRENSRVLVLTNKARAEANTLIRADLQALGEIAPDSVRIDGLTNRQMTGAQLSDARFYEPGNVIQPITGIRRYGLSKGQTYQVLEIDKKTNTITVGDRDGARLSLPVSDYVNRRELGKSLILYEQEHREIATGDRIRFRITDDREGVTNGERAIVTGTGRDGIAYRTSEGREGRLDPDSLPTRGIEHDYAATAHAVQGETVDRVFVAMYATERLVTQKSFYVHISRARCEAQLYTNNVAKLQETISQKTGIRPAGLDVWEQHQRGITQRADSWRRTNREITDPRDPGQPDRQETGKEPDQDRNGRGQTREKQHQQKDQTERNGGTREMPEDLKERVRDMDRLAQHIRERERGFDR